MWAKSDRQATLLMLMAVQQGFTTADRLAVELLDVRRDRRLGLMYGVLAELAGGIRSLSELDFVKGCRERGLPEPESQAIHRTKDGTYYLDFRWPRWRVVVEVDGIQHSWVTEIVDDALRQNSLVLAGDTVLRLPALGSPALSGRVLRPGPNRPRRRWLRGGSAALGLIGAAGQVGASYACVARPAQAV